MRKPRRNELWDRTPGGLIVPRQAGLPTRRFMQKLGMTKCCCGGLVSCRGCEWPATLLMTLSGFSLKWGTTCEDCDALNDTYTMEGVNSTTYTNHLGTYDACGWECIFGDTEGTGVWGFSLYVYQSSGQHIAIIGNRNPCIFGEEIRMNLKCTPAQTECDSLDGYEGMGRNCPETHHCNIFPGDSCDDADYDISVLIEYP